MNFLEQFFDLTFWCLPIYIIATIVLTIIHHNTNATNLPLKQKTAKWIAIINTVFACWFLAFTAYSLVSLKEKEALAGTIEPDESTWALMISAILFLVIFSIKKYRRSPYSMILVSIVILINFIIAFSNVAIGV